MRTQLMPLLLRGLDLPDNEIRASVIDTLHAAAVSSSGEKDNAIVAEHASSLLFAGYRQVSSIPLSAAEEQNFPRCLVQL